MKSELLKADVNGPPHPAFLLPLWLTHSLAPGRTQVVASRTTHLRSMRVVYVFELERMPEALQFKDQRGALRPDCLAARLRARSRCGPVVMLCMVSGSHD